MDKITVCQGVAVRIVAAEFSVDQAIADASVLMTEIMQARQTLKFSAACGDAAIAKISKAIAALAEVRSTMVAAHEDLDEARLRLGVRTRMDFIWKPNSATQDEVARPVLKQVG